MDIKDLAPIGGLALMGTLYGLAQRLGDWRSPVAARWISVLIACMGVAWVFLFLPTWLAWLFAIAIAVVMVVVTKQWIVEVRTSPQEQTVDPVPIQAADSTPASRLRFGRHNRIDIGSGMGYEATLIEIENVERSYLHRCHGVRAELTYTRSQPNETFKATGWFASIHNGKIVEKPVNSLTLDSKDLNRGWLILYVTSHLDGTGQYRFPAPGPH